MKEEKNLHSFHSHIVACVYGFTVALVSDLCMRNLASGISARCSFRYIHSNLKSDRLGLLFSPNLFIFIFMTYFFLYENWYSRNCMRTGFTFELWSEVSIVAVDAFETCSFRTYNIFVLTCAFENRWTMLDSDTQTYLGMHKTRSNVSSLEPTRLIHAKFDVFGIVIINDSSQKNWIRTPNIQRENKKYACIVSSKSLSWHQVPYIDTEILNAECMHRFDRKWVLCVLNWEFVIFHIHFDRKDFNELDTPHGWRMTTALLLLLVLIKTQFR